MPSSAGRGPRSRRSRVFGQASARADYDELRHLVTASATRTTPATAAAAAALLEAIRTVDGLVAARLERHLGLLAARRTGRAEHLARSARAAVAAARAVAVALALGLPLGSAIGAPA